MDRINFLNVEYIYLRIFDAFRNLDIIAILNGVIYWVEVVRPYMIAIFIIMAYVFFYSIVRTKQIEKDYEKKFHAMRLEKQAATVSPEQDMQLHDRWIKVQAHINSESPAEWRLAILEADIMLGDILEKRGYQGDTIGDKLRGIDKSDFLTLDLAWEAHRVRNQIAHEGTDFLLNHREAKRIVDLYQKVFEEFYHI